MHKPFNLYKRKTKKGHIFYCQFYDDTGKRLTAKSTGQTSKAAAENWSIEQLKSGKVITQKTITFQQYAENWWLWDKCNYIKSKLLRGSRISKSYADTQRSYLVHHILPYFKDIKLIKITPAFIEKWLFQLKDTSLTPTTINHILRVLKIMLKEAYREGYLAADPSEGIRQLHEAPKEKNILTPAEVRLLFDDSTIKDIWNGNLKHYTLNLLAASTGIRMGEAQGLQVKSLYPAYIVINKAWTRKYGLHDEAKWGSNRAVPIPSKTSKYMDLLIADSPYREPADFLFYGKDRYTPIDNKTILVELYRALKKAGIADRRDRNITFHSWRHFFNSLMRTRIPDSKIQKVTGHRTLAMTDHYTHFQLDDFKDVMELQEEYF